MLAVGTPVVFSRGGEQQLGIVVGNTLANGTAFYEVSLEDVVRKGVWEDELQPALPEAIEAVLGWLARDPELQATQFGGKEGVRRLHLRSAYMEDLSQALHRLKSEAHAAHGKLPFAVGDHVAVRDKDAWSLGTVLGARTVSGETVCAIDVMEEVRSMPLGALCSLEEAPRTESGYGLGDRVRFLVAGHELDDDYAATICSLSLAEGESKALFCISFDDGDILEDLLESDLVRV